MEKPSLETISQTQFLVIEEVVEALQGVAMYERRVVHAIQHKDEKEFHLRYRTYNSEAERDKTFEMIKESHKNICRVTLTVTAESIEQLRLEL